MHPGKIERSSGRFIFKFKKPVKAIAEGQYLVLYNKDRVIGNGEIRFK